MISEISQLGPGSGTHYDIVTSSLRLIQAFISANAKHNSTFCASRTGNYMTIYGKQTSQLLNTTNLKSLGYTTCSLFYFSVDYRMIVFVHHVAHQVCRKGSQMAVQ